MPRIEARLAELGLALPEPSTPVANYIPYTASGKIVFFSGQIPRKAGAIWPVGRCGDGVSMEDAREAARLCFLAILAHARTAAGGDLDQVARVLRLTGYVASAPGFREQPQVINGASDCAVEVFGDAGRHARSAVGVAELPGGAAVEVEAILELR